MNEISKVRKWADAAIEEWLAGKDEGHFKSWVKDQLDLVMKNMLFAVLGLKRDDYRDHLEIDLHGNARDLNILYPKLRGMITLAADKWIKETFISGPELTAVETKKLQKTYRDEYLEELWRQVRDVAKDRAATQAEALLKKHAPDLFASLEDE